ncbi:MAG: PleD family two-component system response regulator [Bdellovibrionia bacterium]
MSTTPFSPLLYLLDDDPDFTALLNVVLSRLGMRTEIFSKSEDLIARIKAHRPHMAIIDLQLEGGQSGFEVIQQIGALKLVPFPILVVSADHNPVSIAHALELGASDYVTKPLDRDVLTSKLLNFFSSEKLDEASWSFVKAPETRFSAIVELEMEIREVDEFGIRITTRHLLSKGMPLLVSGGIFSDLFGSDKFRLLTVASTWVETSENLYGSYLEFDLTDEELIQSVRKWVTNS